MFPNLSVELQQQGRPQEVSQLPVGEERVDFGRTGRTSRACVCNPPRVKDVMSLTATSFGPLVWAWGAISSRGTGRDRHNAVRRCTAQGRHKSRPLH